MKFNNVGILGVGSHLPSKIITNQDIEKTIDTTHEWIYDKLGINERRIVETELPSDIGYLAALKALESANLTIHDIDLIVKDADSPLMKNKKSPNMDYCRIKVEIGK